MSLRMSPRRKLLLALWILAAIFLSSCSGKSGPALVPVTGVVTWNGRQLTEGSVSFHPLQPGGAGLVPTGAIDQQGHYQLFTNKRTGCPAGPYHVVVFANEPVDPQNRSHAGLPKSLIDRKYNRVDTTPLKVEVRADAPAGTYDLALEK